MALPSLDNKTTIGNLSLDDKASIISSLVRSDKLQLANYGAINFNQNVTVTGTATREGSDGGFGGNVVISILTELKNAILGLSSDIKNFISSSETEKQVSQNFLEAVAKDVKSKSEEEEARGSRGFDEATFKTFGVMTEYLKEIRDSMLTLVDKLGSSGIGGVLEGVGGAGLVGIFSKLFKSLMSKLSKGLGLFGKSLPILAAGYVLSNIPWGNLAQKGKELIAGEGDIADRISSLFGGDFREDGEEGGGTTTTESGSAQPQTPTSPQTNNSGTTTREPTRTSATTGTQQTAVRRRFDSTADASIASESDLSGLIFINHSGKGMPIKLEKQILKALAQRLQYIRKKLGGKTLTINSGYRTPEYNKSVGGAKNSQHKQRKAADVSKKGLNINEQKIFVRSAVESGMGAIGFYDNFIHVDIRNRSNGRISRWGKIPSWALEFINNPEKYSIDTSTASEVKTVSEDHKETGEEGDSTVTQEQKDVGTAERTTPSTTSGNQKTPETATPESGTTGSPEEEEEQEEVGETALREPTSTDKTKKETATKQGGGLFPEHIEKLFRETEEKYDLPKGLLRAIARTETGADTKFEKRLTMGSHKGAKGMMQFLSGTAKQYGLKDRTNPEESIKAAGRYLSHLKEVTNSNDPILLAAAYNAGEGNFAKYRKKGHKIPPFKETKGYVKKVATYMSAPQPETMLAEGDKQTTVPDNKPKGKEESSGNNAMESQQEPTTADATKPESIKDKITETFQSAMDSIKEIKDFSQADMSVALGKYMGEVGSTLGFDPKRLNLPKAKPIRASLEMEKTEEAKKIQMAQAEVEQAKQQKTADANKQSSQQPVVNVVNQGGGQRSESPANAGTPNQLAVRNQNPVIQEVQYKSVVPV